MGRIIQLVDSFTKENVNYEGVTTYHDGTLLDDSKVDNIIYRKKGGDYYIDCSFAAGNPINIKRFGAKGNANHYNPVDKDWYEDPSFTIPANDDTIAIAKAFSLCPDIQINGNFLISDSVNTEIKNQNITGNGRIIVKLPKKYDSKGIRLSTEGSRITGLEILNMNSQGSVIIITDNCTLRDCKFTEVGEDRGYSLWIKNWAENTLIEGCKFIGGDSIWSPQLFIAHSRKTKIVNNYLENAGSWNIHTDHCHEILIDGNTCYNNVFDKEIIATEGQKKFVFNTSMVAFPTRYGLVVRKNGEVLSLSSSQKQSKNGSITITLSSSTKKGDIIRIIAFKGAENLNINSQTFNCTISNNKLYNSGDSNITVASDYKDEVIDSKRTTVKDYPDNIDIINNYIEGAYASNIIAGQVVNRVNIIGNHCKNAGVADLPINLAAGISVASNIYSIIRDNTIEADTVRGLNKVGIIARGNSNKDNMVLKKHIGTNHFIGIKARYNFGSETVATTLYPGLKMEGEYKQYGDLQSLIEDTKWNDKQRPNNNAFFSFATTKSGLTSKGASILGGNGASFERTITGGYTEIVLTKRQYFRNTIMKISFYARTQSEGDGNLQLVYQFSGYTIVSNIQIDSNDVKYYEAFIPILNPSFLSLRLTNGNTKYNIQNLQLSYCSF